MYNYIKISLGILIALVASRFIPHPPNFTSLLALSFYIPAIFGIKFIPAMIIAFAITDIFLGFHSTIFYTWGSVILIGLTTKYLYKSFSSRLFGALLGAILFFIVTNFGVWVGGSYGYSIDGFLSCYVLAIPFFGYSIISTLIYAVIIESLLLLYYSRFQIKGK